MPDAAGTGPAVDRPHGRRRSTGRRRACRGTCSDGLSAAQPRARSSGSSSRFSDRLERPGGHVLRRSRCCPARSRRARCSLRARRRTSGGASSQLWYWTLTSTPGMLRLELRVRGRDCAQASRSARRSCSQTVMLLSGCSAAWCCRTRSRPRRERGRECDGGDDASFHDDPQLVVNRPRISSAGGCGCARGGKELVHTTSPQLSLAPFPRPRMSRPLYGVPTRPRCAATRLDRGVRASGSRAEIGHEPGSGRPGRSSARTRRSRRLRIAAHPLEQEGRRVQRDAERLRLLLVRSPSARSSARRRRSSMPIASSRRSS